MQSYSNCSEVVNGVVVPNSFNGFPFTCRPADAARPAAVRHQPGHRLLRRRPLQSLRPGPANRRKLRRIPIVFARRSGILNAGRARKFLIFEAVLPNPTPSAGLAGCYPVAKFWADLSAVAAPEERTSRLQQFFFDGIPGFAPAIHRDHYGSVGGQIRVNSFLQFPDWSLREFKLKTAL